MKMKRGHANVIIDGQWGSTGKGKLAGYLMEEERPQIAVCDFMPNAGHTFVRDDGKEFVFRQLPVGAAFEDTVVCVGPHAAIDIDNLLKEIAMVEEAGIELRSRLRIHPLAAIVQEADLKAEHSATARIAGTSKGGHAAQSLKALRSPMAMIASQVEILKPFITDTRELVRTALDEGETVLIETAQGYDLGLNHGWQYPYTTGRDCLLGRALDNAGAHPRRLGKVYGSLRTYPIRVGDTSEGSSGPCFPDQRELSWDEVSAMAGRTIRPEMTTVTKRVRRIFTWSDKQFERFLLDIQPDYLFLNFVNYYNDEERSRKVADIDSTAIEFGSKVVLLGTGPRNSDIVVA